MTITATALVFKRAFSEQTLAQANLDTACASRTADWAGSPEACAPQISAGPRPWASGFPACEQEAGADGVMQGALEPTALQA